MESFFSKAIDYIQQRRWLSHVLFWLFLVLFQSIDIESQYRQEGFPVQNFIMLIPKILATYTLIYFQIPKLLYKKKYILFTISILIFAYIFTVIARIFVVYIVEGMLREGSFRQEPILEIVTDVKALYNRSYLWIYFPSFIMLVIKLIKETFERNKHVEQLEKEKFSAELSYFKAQIHPHFLFNTLNNLYALTVQKSDKASDTVLKLSEMLDYMLYQCNDDRVSIDKEIQLIQNYLDLEQLRYGDRLDLIYNHTVDNKNTKIAPLILISLIENAFKHGVSGSIEDPKIKIDLTVEKDQLHFSVFNTKNKMVQDDMTDFKQGIGLNNTKKQLKLLYPEKHSIKIIEEDISFKVILNIDLE